MNPPFEKVQYCQEKNKIEVKFKLDYSFLINHQIHHKNIIGMENQEFPGKDLDRTESNNNFKTFQYSMKSSYSLHSNFSSSQQIQDSNLTKDNSMPCSQSDSLRTNSFSVQNLSPVLLPRQIKLNQLESVPYERNFMKNKETTELLEPEIMTRIIMELNNEQNTQVKSMQANRKTYKSCLHEIVDKNHLQSPSRQIRFYNQSSEQYFEMPELKLEQQNDPQTGPIHNQSTAQKLSEQSNKQSPNSQPLIRPIAIMQRKIETEDSSSQSPDSSPIRKPKNHHLQVRRIPSNLYDSYDQLYLTIDKKLSNKDHIKIPLKIKQKSSQNGHKDKTSSNQNPKRKNSGKNQNKRQSKVQTSSKKTSTDQQLLVSLQIIEGYCQMKTEELHIFQTKFVINKNTICFQNFKKLLINNITKIKFIEKEEKQISIKITYESEEDGKIQNYLVTLLNSPKDSQFSSSFELFSHLILRKLLLMKLSINELNQRFEIQSPPKSPQSSPLHSPLALTSTLSQNPSQNVQKQPEGETLFCSNLYRKSAFFNSWQKKYFVLSQNSLQSFACSPVKDEKQKPSNELHKTNEIWTRFELIYGYLVIKMWHSKIEKVQIGVPLCDFTNSEGKQNWLFGLCKYVVWKKYNHKVEKASN